MRSSRWPDRRDVIVLSIAWLVCCVGQLASVSTSAASAATVPSAERVEIKELSAADYPRLSVRAVVHSDAPLRDFRIRQDGTPVKKLTVEPLGQRPMSVLLLLDVSGSMKGKPLEAAKKAATLFVSAAGKQDRIAVASFSSRVEMASSFTRDRARAGSAVDSLEIGGKTAVYDGVLQAVQWLQAEKSQRKAVILLSDGSDSASKASKKSAIAAVTGAGVPVYAVALKSPDLDVRGIKEIATASKGKLISKVDPAALSGVFGDISREFKNEYRVLFDGRTERSESWIDLQVMAGDRSLSASKRFKVPSVKGPVIQEVTVPVGLSTRIGSYGFMVLGGLAAFSAVILIVMGIGLAPKKNVLSNSLDYYFGLRSSAKIDRSIGGARGLSGALSGISRLISGLTEKHGLSEMAAETLDRAGLPVRPNEFMIAHLSVVLIIGFILSILFSSSATAVVGIVVAVIVPLLTVGVLINRRIAKLDEQLPDTLMTVSGLLRAGFALHQALESAATDTPSPMSDELRKVLVQVNFGVSLDEALSRMAERVNSKDFDWVVVAITINRETGGNLADILEKVADNVRARQGFKRKVQALAAEGKMSAQILSALPFVVWAGFSALNPEYMSRLLTTPIGLMMATIGLTLLGIGMLWLRSITRIEF